MRGVEQIPWLYDAFMALAEPFGLGRWRRWRAVGGELRMLEHVRHHRLLLARLQDLAQPAWTWCAGGCHPNRDTEASVERTGFRIDRSSREASGVMRRFVARPEEAAHA